MQTPFPAQLCTQVPKSMLQQIPDITGETAPTQPKPAKSLCLHGTDTDPA